MTKYLLDAALAVLFFIFVWKTVGKPLVGWTSKPPPTFDEPTHAMSVDELKACRAKLHDRISKLKNKAEIAKLREQLNKINDQLAELA